MNRDSSYDKILAKELQDLEFAKEFLLGLMEGEEGLFLLDALKHTIWRMGIREFSEISGVPEKCISRMLHSENIPKIDTLDKYMAPFGLKVKISLENVA
jgi:DNA-binding phage protein